MGSGIGRRVLEIAKKKDPSIRKSDIIFLIHPLVFFEFLKVAQESDLRKRIPEGKKIRIKKFVDSLKDSFSDPEKHLKKVSKMIGFETCWLNGVNNLDPFSPGVCKKVYEFSSRAMLDSIHMKNEHCPRMQKKLLLKGKKRRGEDVLDSKEYIFLKHIESLCFQLNTWLWSTFDPKTDSREKRIFYYLLNYEKIKKGDFKIESLPYGKNSFSEYSKKIEKIYKQLLLDLEKVKGASEKRDKIDIIAFVIAYLHDEKRFGMTEGMKRTSFHLFFESKVKWNKVKREGKVSELKKHTRPFFNTIKSRLFNLAVNKNCVLKPLDHPEEFFGESQEWICSCGEIYNKREILGKAKSFYTKISTADVFIASSSASLKKLRKKFFIVSRDADILSILKSYGLSGCLINPWKK